MSTLAQRATLAAAAASSAAAPWRRCGVVLGAMLGLFAGFNGLFFATLPFFVLPIGREFGWGRGEVSLAAVMSMLGVSLASPLVGRLLDRWGVVRVVGSSVVLLAAAMWAFGHLPGQLPLFAALAFVLGAVGSATTMVGYLAVLQKWFDHRLGLALGLAGVGLGLGVILNGWVATALIQHLGWRDAYGALAAMALLLGLPALRLLLLPGAPPTAAIVASSAKSLAGPAMRGDRWAEALRTSTFWLLLVSALLLPLAILGSAVHAPALYADRGMTPQQAALGAAVAGMGAMGARIAVGALLDRFFAPRVAMGVFAMGAAGLFIGARATGLPALVLGSLLAGMAIGAEGDLVPYLVRRYFGSRSFGAIFGSVFAAYALGGVLGPAIYGVAFDRLGGYARVMQAGALACVLCVLAMLPLRAYRFGARAALAPDLVDEPPPTP